MPKRIALLQPGRLGDIIICAPVAKWYYDHGYRVTWPINDKYRDSVTRAFPYAEFIPVQGHTSMQVVHGCYNILSRGNYERVMDLCFLALGDKRRKDLDMLESERGYPVRFDEYKYYLASVPFDEKWKFYISRDRRAEEELYSQVVSNPSYIVVQFEGSTKSRTVPVKAKGRQVIHITQKTRNIFDWLKVLEGADELVLIDSCFANLVEQMGICKKKKKTFILRSGEFLTPTLRGKWEVV